MDVEAQNDELVVLSSIYEECFHEAPANEDRKGGELVIHLDLPDTFTLTTHNAGGCVEKHQVAHLPPVHLHFNYPNNYPTAAAPRYTLTCKWITRTQLSLMCQELDKLWEENKGDVILYTWSQHIKENSLSLLGISDNLNVDDIRPKRCDLMARGGAVGASHHHDSMRQVDGTSAPSHQHHPARTIVTNSSASGDQGSHAVDTDSSHARNARFNSSNIFCDNSVSLNGSGGGATAVASRQRVRHQSSSGCDERTIQDVGPKMNILMLLRDYDQQMQTKVFQNKSFECKVCFADKVGSQCVKFWPCGHVYCKGCMKGYFEVQIKEGNFKFLKCPTEKCQSEANPKQVEELVSKELYERWDALLLSSTISALGDTQPCPRQHCQYPVTIDNSQGYCPACSFVFCSLCRFGEHGVDPCKLKNSEARKVLEKYVEGDPDTRRALEDRFGKKYLIKLQDEFLTMNYLSDNAKKCPRCSANIEKITGCNKMLCQRCGSNFCWLCMGVLDPCCPYEHFNGSKSSCYNRLFEGMDDPDEDEMDEEFYDDWEEWED